ncbi:MAG TPA: AAA domain-containing protein [Dictyobacter sp.]|jgi:DNA replication ATP-dependent helicase Dna2|nr:AAA domain-containing protein [Dictyobacter sp.]
MSFASICDHCGAENRDQARFCHACGMGLNIIQPVTTTQNHLSSSNDMPEISSLSSQDDDTHECFLCPLDPHHTCHTAVLSGTLLAVREQRIQNKAHPVLLLAANTTLVELHLEPQHQPKFLQELASQEEIVTKAELKLRVYHLPRAPKTVERHGESYQQYTGNAYTMIVLEPDVLLNITELNQAEYCARQYLLNRLLPSTTSTATIRGNLIHYCFTELLKEQNRTTTTSMLSEQQVETPRQTLQRHLEKALQNNRIDIALVNESFASMRVDVEPHLDSLAQWYSSESNTLWDFSQSNSHNQSDTNDAENRVRAETYLIAPEIGLRGRMDLFWQHTDRQRLLELKTGNAKGTLPRREHRWQVNGYQALLAVRRNARMQRAMGTLLYSGTPGKAQAFGVPGTIRDLQRVNETRNRLALSRLTSIPPAPPGAGRCSKCALRTHCLHISTLLQWEPPMQEETDVTQTQTITMNASEKEKQPSAPKPQKSPVSTHKQVNEADQEFFAQNYALLHQEEQAQIQQQALLWQLRVRERIENGSALKHLEQQGEAEEYNDGYRYVFRCHNTSELRDGDEILLSDGSPITGEVVTGTVIHISPESITVWTREKIAHPNLIDRFDNDLVHLRTLQNLLRWQYVSPHLRDLVAGRIRPRFLGEESKQRLDFNQEQQLAVIRAIQTQDYLLIQGPPGTGKTSVIAEIVKQLTARGQRVMLAAFTNQAVDNMLKRLDKEGFHDYVRLGHERSVEQSIHNHLLSRQLQATLERQDDSEGNLLSDTVLALLNTTPVVASTTATWSTDRYIPHTTQQRDELLAPGVLFDVAIIDEAGQLTLPAILGALRFAKRFILVGDEKQLPPLVLSQDAANAGLGLSLFQFLKEQNDAYMSQHNLDIPACVALRTQYRMNKWIANFSSTVFYDKQLAAHPAIANQQLSYKKSQPLREEWEEIQQALEPAHPLVFLDVQDEQTSINTKQSDAEARAVRAVVAALLRRGIEENEIGIIAPYRAQVANIRRHLFSDDLTHRWQALTSDTPLSVDTVDRFQGGERLIMIMSFATTHALDSSNPRYAFLTNGNRLNVALTRAQRKLILVGSVPILEQLPIFNRLITYCRSMKTLIPVEEKAAALVQNE